MKGHLSHNDSHARIVLVIPRGEAVRNFLYSDALRFLSARAKVTLLSLVDDEPFRTRFGPLVDEIVPLREFKTPRHVSLLRHLVENAHDRWLWSAVARNNWELRDRRAAEEGKRLQRVAVKLAARALAWEPVLHAMTRLEQRRAFQGRTTQEFDALFDRIRPDLVFNASHIHGIAGELPLRVAHARGIPTAGFIFSWDNLTSRSRIFVPYDHYLVWHEAMKRQLIGIYPRLDPDAIHVTGTPQFDFHFDERFQLSREELCARIGIDPARPFVLYTSGIWNHFYEEHRHVDLVIRCLRQWPADCRPQLVVRNYAKGTSDELRKMAADSIPDVVFPKVLWDDRLLVPAYEDLPIYSSLLRHAALGINAASTVTLELLLLDKPVINLDFDPPGSTLPWCMGYQRHIRFDHFLPVAESGATMVARSEDDMLGMLRRGLSDPACDAAARRDLVRRMFGLMADGQAGMRVAEALVALAGASRAGGSAF